MSGHPPHSEFEEELRALEARLEADLVGVRARLKHPGNKGASAEAAFRRILASYLPRRIAVGNGEIIDSLGGRSRQCDVVLASDAHPNWFTPDEPARFLVEAVAGVAEVKSLLTSTNLKSAVEAVRQYRSLKPNVSHSQIQATESDFRRFYRSPPYFLFAYDSEVGLEAITDVLQDASGDMSRRIDESLDGVFVLGLGYVLNFGDGKGAMVVADARTGARLEGYHWDEGSPLMMLMRWLPLALALPHTQLPVLASYLLTDLARFSNQRA